MKKTIISLFAVTAIIMNMLAAVPIATAKAGDEIIGVHKIVIGTYDEDGNIIFNPQTKSVSGVSAARLNANALNQLCNNDKKKTVIIPSGSKVPIEYYITLGSNTTINAKGATIIQTDKSKGIFLTEADALNYNSVKNITINGGLWKNASTANSTCTMMRFAHGKNVKIKNATIYTNYSGHGIELIAMKNVTVENCTVKALGKKSSNSVEEAIQIDVATPRTAPGLVQYGAKYVNGQTCQNIKIIKNTVVGSRGICANFASLEDKYKNKFHNNITIKRNTIIGKSAEGLALFNVKNATVKNNKITSNSTRTSESYSVGLNIIAQGSTSSLSKATLKVSGNTVKGGRQGIQIASLKSSKYKKAIVKNNKCYAYKGKSVALAVSSSAVKLIVKTNNKLYKR